MKAELYRNARGEPRVWLVGLGLPQAAGLTPDEARALVAELERVLAEIAAGEEAG